MLVAFTFDAQFPESHLLTLDRPQKKVHKEYD